MQTPAAIHHLQFNPRRSCPHTPDPDLSKTLETFDGVTGYAENVS